jgi:hypothetical protein
VERRVIEEGYYDEYVDYYECCGVRWEFYDEDNEISLIDPSIYLDSVKKYLDRNKNKIIFVHKLVDGFEKIMHV